MTTLPPSLADTQRIFIEAAENLYQTSEYIPEPLHMAAQAVVNCLTSGSKVMCAGQSMGAWLAQQTVQLLVHGLGRQRPPLAALDVSHPSDVSAFNPKRLLSSRVMALGQSGDIFLAFAVASQQHSQEELALAIAAAKELDMMVVLISAANDSHWANSLQDTDMWLALPCQCHTSLFGAAWLVVNALCKLVDSQLLGDEL